MRCRAFAVLAVAALATVQVSSQAVVDVLSPVGGLPPNLVGQLREPAGFMQTDDGRYLVFDRRAQTVVSIDAQKTKITPLVKIGPSDGEILRPLAFVPGSERTFFVLDNPSRYERVQKFYDTGTALSVFRRFSAADEPLRLNADAMLTSGFAAISPVGGDLLTQIPDGVALISQLNMEGHVTRRIGQLRATGQESKADIHRALNAGIALASPDGSFYFVFTNGAPMFRKYSSAGDFLFERHIEGPELDHVIQTLPTVWVERATVEGREFPLVTSTVTTAAIDARGQLWISLSVPMTYVYNADGNKIRTVQFRGAGAIAPKSLFFTKQGHLLVTPGCYEFDVK